MAAASDRLREAMTPAARLQAAIEILEGLGESRMPADRFIREYFRARRYAGSKDRAAIGGRVYTILRSRAHFAWRMQSTAPRALVIASVLAEEGDIPALFAGGPYAPAQLTAAEHAAIAAPMPAPPLHVRGEYPQWLEPELRRAFGDRLLDEMRALQPRAPIDLRVNTLKANRHYILKQLPAEGYDAETTGLSPLGIRIPAGASGLEKTKLFASGGFEVQDAASQIAALLVDAKPGMRVLDLAAGAGGKSLTIAAQMRNEGEVLALDDNPARLKPLPERAARAGATCITVAENPGGPKWGSGKFDRVLVDA